MVNLNPFCNQFKHNIGTNKDDDENDNRYLHKLEKGDHVVRWTRLVVYPIQVHGIVLSASDDVVTIVDFGLTAIPSNEKSGDENQQRQLQQQKQEQEAMKENDSRDSNSNDINTEEEIVINHEDRAMMKTCEQHRHAIQGPDRINILVLTDEKDIRQWKKVEYAVKEIHEKKQKFSWFWKDNKNNHDEKKKAIVASESGNENENHQSTLERNNDESENSCNEVPLENKEENDATISETTQNSGEKTIETNQSESHTQCVEPEQQQTTIAAELNVKNENVIMPTNDVNETKAKKMSPMTTKTTEKEEEEVTELPESLRTRSDPTNIVIARVRYLVSNPQILPPHNIFYSNSGAYNIEHIIKRISKKINQHHHSDFLIFSFFLRMHCSMV